MYVINEKTKIVNEWADNEINHQRLASGKYGVVEYKGEVEQCYDGRLYAKGHAPVKPEPTKEEQSLNRAFDYAMFVDPITSHIQRLKDEQQTPEVIAEIDELTTERAEKVAEIKAKYPYPDEVDNKDNIDNEIKETANG